MAVPFAWPLPPPQLPGVVGASPRTLSCWKIHNLRKATYDPHPQSPLEGRNKTSTAASRRVLQRLRNWFGNPRADHCGQ